MRIERAMEILDPNHREHYESIDIVNEACEMGRRALEKQIPKKPIPNEKDNIRLSLCYNCPECGRTFSGTGIADYCYHCGQALDWSEE